MFLTLPITKLFKLYGHAFSLLIFAFAHYMSTTYVYLEQDSEDKELKLDNFVKLERHGFHFLAQLMLSVVQSCVLGLESDVGRAFLTVFTLPIVARMCGFPLDKLILAHNVACSLVMLSICIYVLNRVPDMVHGMRTAFRQVKAIFVVRGLAGGFVTVWRRLRIAQLMTCAWLTMFVIRMYVEMWEKGRSWREAGPALLEGIAESTNTPISLLALALTVSFVCKWVVDGAQMAVGGRRDHGHVLAHSGYTEALTLVLLCLQTGLLGMKTEQKAFLLGLVLFIVMSALLQSLYELLEPQLLSLAATPNASGSRHIRCLVLALILFVAPIVMAGAITTFLPVDLWCVIIVSNCVLTTIHAASSTVQYIIGMVEVIIVPPCQVNLCKFSYVTVAFSRTMGTQRRLNVLDENGWFFFGFSVLWFFRIQVDVDRMETLLGSMTARQAAVKNINRLPRASKEELKARCDVCAICFMEMWEEARVTPCKHFFHGSCLRKWLSVRQVCPLCYAELVDPDGERTDGESERDFSPDQERVRERNAEWRELRAMEGARDMWPLMEQVYDNETDSDSDSSSATEYTLASTDD
ncbi:zinc finger, C3HC4 type [Necator americanus]|uniref:Zinc finger, C3HC4 type n=1 Tax=Necator americanus TaxID=51031 RepID=W2SG47_NECAM|nr:zinc finger, C3HC4 type [Necator americanus]ETN68513.1 zinc finger, C3HC4 type [Necator americanus]